MKKYLQLAVQIFRDGTLRSTGQNFNENRENSLKNFQEFIPQHSIVKPGIKADAGHKNLFKNLIAQAAFIKASFRKKSGHLSAQNIGYIRIPKSANTSVSYAMLIKKYAELKDRNPNEFQINFLADVNLESVSETNSETFFTVTRDPFARLVSVYRDFFETKRNEFIYSDYLFGILKPDITFAEFVSQISKIPDRLKDQHFRPQYFFVKPYESKGGTVKIYKLEEPLALEVFLQENGMELHHRNKSEVSYDYTQYYTADLLNQVYAIYQQDVEKLGYTAVYQQLKQRLTD